MVRATRGAGQDQVVLLCISASGSDNRLWLQTAPMDVRPHQFLLCFHSVSADPVPAQAKQYTIFIFMSLRADSSVLTLPDMQLSRCCGSPCPASCGDIPCGTR